MRVSVPSKYHHMPHDTTKVILNIFKTTCILWPTFFTQRFENNSTSISSSIASGNFPSFEKETKPRTHKQEVKTLLKDSKSTQRIIKIARCRRCNSFLINIKSWCKKRTPFTMTCCTAASCGLNLCI